MEVLQHFFLTILSKDFCDVFQIDKVTKFFVVEHVKNLDAHCAFAFTFSQVLVVCVDEVNGRVDPSAGFALISRDIFILTLIEKE